MRGARRGAGRVLYIALIPVCCHVLPCVAVCCRVLQCVTVCCSVLQCVAVYSIYHLFQLLQFPLKMLHD